MDKTYKTISGDTWDIVALLQMGSEKHTDKLIKANVQYRQTVVFPAGVMLTIPDVETAASAELPPWKRGTL